MFMRIRDKTADFRNSMLRLKSSRRKKITFTREWQIAFSETWNAKRKSPSVLWRHPCQIVSFPKKIGYPEYLFVFVHSFCSLNYFPFHHQQNDMFGTTTSNLPFLRLPTALSVDAFRDPTRTILWMSTWHTEHVKIMVIWWIWSYSYLYKYVEIKFRFICHRHFHIHLNSIWFQICIHINIHIHRLLPKILMIVLC